MVAYRLVCCSHQSDRLGFVSRTNQIAVLGYVSRTNQILFFSLGGVHLKELTGDS